MNGQVEPENWLNWLGKFIGRPVKALELGSFNGTATSWMLQNILVHEDSRILCVDSLEGIPSLPEMKDERLHWEFEAHIAPWRGKVKFWKMRTVPALAALIGEEWTFDLAYIDASHVARDVLFDACACYRICKPGSVIIFDDYGLNWDLPDLPCRIGIDAFYAAHRQHLRLLEGSSYQFAVEVMAL